MWCPTAQVVDATFGDASGMLPDDQPKAGCSPAPSGGAAESRHLPNRETSHRQVTPPTSFEARHDSAPRCNSAEARADCRTTTAAAAEAAGPAANMHLRPDNEQDGGALVGTVEPMGTTPTIEQQSELELTDKLDNVLARSDRDAQAGRAVHTPDPREPGSANQFLLELGCPQSRMLQQHMRLQQPQQQPHLTQCVWDGQNRACIATIVASAHDRHAQPHEL